MTTTDFRSRRRLLALLAAVLAWLPASALSQTPPQSPATQEEFKPQVGQAGKDVIWVPTPEYLVDRLLQMTQVTPNDFVVDLGSGDGRTVIAAAKKFHANSLGIEYNADMVVLSKKNAVQEGVSDKAKFVEGDIFATDFSRATVVTLYLLPDLNLRLRPMLLEMKPGTRVASHQFSMGEWQPDETSNFDGRSAYFWVVPARVEGNWTLAYGGKKPGAEHAISLTQKFQMVEGAVVLPGAKRLGLRDLRLRGERFDFSFVDERGVLREFSGRVSGDAMAGSMKVAGKAGPKWRARRSSS